MRRKFISLSLFGALLLGALTACGETGTGTDTGTGTGTGTGTTDASAPAMTGSGEAAPMESTMASPAASPAP